MTAVRRIRPPIRPGHWLALDVVAALLFGLLLFENTASGLAAVGPATLPRALLGAALALPVAARRRWPTQALAVLLGEILLLTASDHPPTVWVCLPVAFVLYLVAATGNRSRTISLATLTLSLGLVALVTVVLAVHHDQLGTSASVVAFAGSCAAVLCLAAWVVGYAVNASRAYHEALRLRENQQAAAELDAAHNAVIAQRLSIARDVHDVVAHSMSAVVVQAGVGHRLSSSQPVVAAAALASIEETARGALTEMRRLLHMLRDPDSAAKVPAPQLCDVEQLVSQTALAGVEVHTKMTGPMADLPANLQLAAYRVVQEALTNVIKHSGALTAFLAVSYDGDELVIDVANGNAGAIHNSGVGPVLQPGTASGSEGLVGMAERVRLYGGTVTAGSTADGGYRVLARFPVRGDPA